MKSVVAAPSAIARNTAVQVAGEIASRGALIVFYAVLARELGQQGFGEFTFALSLSLVLVLPGGFGLDDIVARTVARDRGDIDRVLGDALAIKMTLGALAVAVAGALALFAGFSHSTSVALVLFAVSGLLEIITPTAYAVFQGLDDLVPEATGLFLQRFSRAGLGIAVLLLGGGVAAIAVVFVVGALLALTCASWMLVRRVGPALHFSREHARVLFLTALPIGIGSLFDMVLWRADAVLLGWLKDDTAVGLYGAASRLVEAPMFVSSAFIAAMVPFLSRLNRSSNPPIARAYEGATKVLTVALFPIAAGLILFADPLLQLMYGDSFTAAVPAVRLLGATIVLLGLAHLSFYVLISQDRQRMIPWAVAAISLQNVLLVLLLVPSRSFEGAALAGLLSEATYAGVLGALALRSAGRVSARRILTGPMIGCAAMAVVALVAGPSLAGLVIAGIVYVASLVGVERVLCPSDLSLVRASLTRPGNAEWLLRRRSAGGDPPEPRR